MVQNGQGTLIDAPVLVRRCNSKGGKTMRESCQWHLECSVWWRNGYSSSLIIHVEWETSGQGYTGLCHGPKDQVRPPNVHCIHHRIIVILDCCNEGMLSGTGCLRRLVQGGVIILLSKGIPSDHRENLTSWTFYDSFPHSSAERSQGGFYHREELLRPLSCSWLVNFV